MADRRYTLTLTGPQMAALAAACVDADAMDTDRSDGGPVSWTAADRARARARNNAYDAIRDALGPDAERWLLS
jgi:hypothetical protein